MKTSIHDHHEKERMALSYANDGLADFYTGLIIFGFGLFIFAEMAWMVGVFAAVFIPVLLSIKKTVVATRLSDAELAPLDHQGVVTANVRLFILGLVALLVGLLAFLLLTSGNFPEQVHTWLNENFGIMAGIFAGIVLAVIGVSIKCSRFYGYALLAFCVLGIGALLGIEFPLTVIALGAVISGVGLVYLIHFLRTHPLMPNPPQR
jgi:MFS family permease